MLHFYKNVFINYEKELKQGGTKQGKLEQFFPMVLCRDLTRYWYSTPTIAKKENQRKLNL